MCREAYDSPSVPITWPRLDYCSGTNDYIEVVPEAKQQILNFYKTNPNEAKATFGDNPFEVKNIMKHWVRSKDQEYHFIPTDTLYITIDKEAVKKSGMMMAADSIPDRMVISLKSKNALYKNDLMMLEIIAQCNWTRPVYVASTVGSDNYMNLGDNFVLEGLANRITPFTTNVAGAKNFDSERVYQNMMTRFKFGGVDKKGIYLDETVMRMCYTHRRLFAQLALTLIAERKNDKAAKVLAYAEKVLPTYNVPVNYLSGGIDIAKAYAHIGNKAKAAEYTKAAFENAHQYMIWYNSLKGGRFTQAQQDCMMHIYVMSMCVDTAEMFDKALAKKLEAQLNADVSAFHAKGGVLPQ